MAGASECSCLHAHRLAAAVEAKAGAETVGAVTIDRAIVATTTCARRRSQHGHARALRILDSRPSDTRRDAALGERRRANAVVEVERSMRRDTRFSQLVPGWRHSARATGAPTRSPRADGRSNQRAQTCGSGRAWERHALHARSGLRRSCVRSRSTLDRREAVDACTCDRRGYAQRADVRHRPSRSSPTARDARSIEAEHRPSVRDEGRAIRHARRGASNGALMRVTGEDTWSEAFVTHEVTRSCA